MLKLCLVAIFFFGATACSGKGAKPPAKSGRIVTSLGEIAGAWDIASFDGYKPVRLHDGIRRAYMNVTSNGLNYVIECNYSGNPARIDKAGVLHKVGDEPQIQTLMGCGPAREARDAAFFGFFASRPKVSWAGDGRLRLANARTELILERPEVRRLANIPSLGEITGRWVPLSATRLIGSNGYEGRGFQEPYPVVIGKGVITYRGCGGAKFAFRYTMDARMEIVEAKAREDCGFDDASTVLIRVLRSGPLVERTAGGGIALTVENEVISLRAGETTRH